MPTRSSQTLTQNQDKFWNEIFTSICVSKLSHKKGGLNPEQNAYSLQKQTKQNKTKNKQKSHTHMEKCMCQLE